ncbi:hypothetical protein Ccrd_020179, partial [Cynara cardunculus var. scolymus]
CCSLVRARSSLIYSFQSRESKQKREELLQKWSEGHTRHRSSARMSRKSIGLTSLNTLKLELTRKTLKSCTRRCIKPFMLIQPQRSWRNSLQRSTQEKLTYDERKEKLIERLNALNAASGGADDE